MAALAGLALGFAFGRRGHGQAVQQGGGDKGEVLAARSSKGRRQRGGKPRPPKQRYAPVVRGRSGGGWDGEGEELMNPVSVGAAGRRPNQLRESSLRRGEEREVPSVTRATKAADHGDYKGGGGEERMEDIEDIEEAAAGGLGTRVL